jgi:hypothetical protein
MIWLPKYGKLAKPLISQARIALHTKRCICLQKVQIISPPACWAEHPVSYWLSRKPLLLTPAGNQTVPGIVRISAEYDNEAKVWVAQSDDLPLVTEAEIVEQLMPKLPGVIRDLVDDNIRAPASRSN